jgi:hypothetical protein
MDFIFIHKGGLDDIFYCEDKPTISGCGKDNKKLKFLRQSTVDYWSTILPFEGCLKYLTIVTCQFNKLKLQISATKVIFRCDGSLPVKNYQCPL